MAIKLGDAVLYMKGDNAGLRGALRDSEKASETSFKAIAQSARRIGVAMTAMGGAIVGTLGFAVRKSMDFEQAIQNAASVTGKSGDEFTRARDKMADMARTLGSTTVFSASEAANAFYDLSSKGFDVASMSVSDLLPFLNLAAATQSDLAMTTEIVTGTLRGFGLSTSETARVADVLAGTIGTSAASMERFATTMPYVATAAAQTGVSLEEMSAVIGMLYNNAIPASTAGTALRQVILALNDPTSTVTRNLNAMGIQTHDLNLRAQGLAGVFQTLASRGLTAELALQVFGQQSASVAALLVDNSMQVQNTTRQYENMGGVAQRMADQQLNTLWGRMKQLGSVTEEVQMQIGDALIPILSDLVMDYVIPFVEWLAKTIKENEELVKGIIVTVAAAGALMLVLGPIIAGFASLVIAMAGVTIIGLKVAAVIAAVIAGIGVLIAAVLAVVYFWDDFVDAAKYAWDTLKEIVMGGINFVVDYLKQLGDVIVWAFTNPLEAIEVAWLNIVEFFQGIWDAIVGIFTAGWRGIAWIFEMLAGFGSFLGEAIGSGFAGGVPQFADGGVMGRGGVAMVGERGPELVRLPTGARVHSTTETESMLNGGGMSIGDINIQVVEPRATADEIARVMFEELQRRLGGKGGQVRPARV